MASAMSGSRGRAFEHPRPPSLIVARMPQLALLAFVLVNLNQPVKAENKPGPHGDAGEYAWVSMFIASCDDLPDQRTEVHGIVKVLGDIICPENRIVRVSQSMGGEVTFVGEHPMTIKGVHFEVPSYTYMAFGAPLLNFEKEKYFTQEIFSVQGSLAFFTEQLIPAPQGSTPEDKHSIVRVKNGGSVNTNGVMHFTDSGFTVAKGVGVPDLTNEDRRWAQRPRHQNHATSVSPLPSLFHSPPTTLELFGERLDTGLLYIKAGEELQWPSSMFSEDGTMLSLGADGSILLLKHAADYFGAESDELLPPTVTLVAADLREASRLLEKRLLGGEKAAGVDLSGPKDALKIPGCAGSGAGGKVVLTLTDEGDVEVSVDGTRVLHRTEPSKGRTWGGKIWDRVRGRKTPKGDYEMHMVSDGFEVRLDGVTIWGVYSADVYSVKFDSTELSD